MRDIIWTLIIIWLVYKVAAIFKNNAKAKSNLKYNTNHSSQNPDSNPNGNPKVDLTKPLNKEGEYVDYEEIK